MVLAVTGAAYAPAKRRGGENYEGGDQWGEREDWKSGVRCEGRGGGGGEGVGDLWFHGC
jgi:hypothetical protein